MTTRRTIARRITRTINSYPRGCICNFDSNGTYVSPIEGNMHMIAFTFGGAYPGRVTVKQVENDLKNQESRKGKTKWVRQTSK